MAKALSNKEQTELLKLEMAPVVSSSVRSELSYSSSSESEEEEIEDEEEILMDSCPYTINFLTEFFGTAIQMFIGCLGSIYTFDIGPVITAFSFGLGRLMCYEIFNHISPLHVNPAKSLGFYVLGRMHFLKLVIYMGGQFSGAVVGVSIVTAVAPSNVDNICVTVPHRATVGSALVMEFVSTLILMLVVAAATDPVNEKKKDSLSLTMGCVVLGLVLTLDIYTTAGKNPARSLAPALVYNNWKYQWLYKVGPFCGAVTGALLYRFIFDVHHHSLHKFLKHRRHHHRHHHHHEPQPGPRIQSQNLQLRK